MLFIVRVFIFFPSSVHVGMVGWCGVLMANGKYNRIFLVFSLMLSFALLLFFEWWIVDVVWMREIVWQMCPVCSAPFAFWILNLCAFVHEWTLECFTLCIYFIHLFIYEFVYLCTTSIPWIYCILRYHNSRDVSLSYQFAAIRGEKKKKKGEKIRRTRKRRSREESNQMTLLPSNGKQTNKWEKGENCEKKTEKAAQSNVP